MSENGSKQAISRILVALDASSDSDAGLEVAVELASTFQAEVLGLFIEDIHLLDLARSQTARVISLLSPTVRPLVLHELELQLRCQAATIKERLSSMADRAGISWRFHVARGPVPAQLLAAAAEADLVILGKKGRSFGGEVTKVGSSVQAILRQGQASALILQYGIRFQMPISLFFDGSASSKKALEVAARLVHIKSGHLIVFLLSQDAEGVKELRGDVQERLSSLGLSAEYRRLIAPSFNGILLAVQREGSLPLVVPADSGFLKDNDALRALINQLPNPILLIR